MKNLDGKKEKEFEEDPFDLVDDAIEDEDDYEELDSDIDFEDPNEFVFHCKPCFNFQTIEFDWVGHKDSIPEMMELYKKIMLELSKIALPQPNQKGSEELATQHQKEIMDKFGIKYTGATTKKEAQKLISDNINK